MRLVLALIAAIAATSAAAAETTYPSRTVRLVVPYPPGASNDILARGLAQRLTEQLGHTVIIDNRPGAGGHIGAEAVARANPDGHTLLLGTTAATTLQRTRLMPELGTVAEQAVPGFDVSSWTAVLVPRQTPRALVERLHQEISRAVIRPDMQSFIVSQGAEPVILGPAETARRIAAESARWGKVAKAAAVKVD